MAYNASVAKESKRKFPSTTHCMTTHSMAYAATVKPLKLKLGTFSYRDIIEPITYDKKCDIVMHLRTFCLSRFTSFDDYAADNGVSSLYVKLVKKYLSLMQSGSIECTHDFYLKLFHILLADGSLTYDQFDFIMLDEAGDLNEVTLEIFKLLPSPRKIAVGDKHQNIYMFNDTINCFKVLANEGTTLQMTQSFRVAKHIASRIEAFCQKYLDPSMSFKGTDQLTPAINSRAFITRTNSALVQRMIQLNASNTPYGLTRKALDIFRVPLMLCNLKYQGFITDTNYKHLQDDVDDWYEDTLIHDEHSSIFSYLLHKYPDDIQLSQAIRLVQTHKKSTIIATYEEARKHEKTNHSLTLGTAHSMKGLEFDEVTIADDLNESLQQAIDLLNEGAPVTSLISKHLESLNLYYVACTRASKVLYNARHL